MPSSTLTRRTGALLAGVVPPTGTPLPQQTLGVGTWIGTPQDLADPARRAELLRIADMRRELRAGRLHAAARVSLELQSDPPDPATARTVAVLRSVAAAQVDAPSPEAILRYSLQMLGPVIPPLLLDTLLTPGSRLPVEAAERVCLQHDTSPATVARLRVLLVRRAAQDYRAAPDGARLAELRRRVQDAVGTPMHRTLQVWAQRVGERAEAPDLTDWIDALGHNLALTEPKNGELHGELSKCFAGGRLVAEDARQLTRLSFSAWSALRDATDGTSASELVSFSAQAAALRQVFEVLRTTSTRP